MHTFVARPLAPLLLAGLAVLATGFASPSVSVAAPPPSVLVVRPASFGVPIAPTRRLRIRRFALELEAGPVWQTRNEVALPGDTGTRIALDDLTGAGPFAWGRVTLDWRLAPRHAVRFLAAPLTIQETGPLGAPATFDGLAYAAGVTTRATYTFNSYRLTYRYRLFCRSGWTLHVGGTAKIRQAEIELIQGGLRGRKADLGFVPLLHVDAEKRLGRRWRFVADLDAAAAPQGRAFDLALKLHYDIDDRWSVGFGYRMLEGGADNDTVYTFAWLHQALASVTFRF